jgi:hypothetical protein
VVARSDAFQVLPRTPFVINNVEDECGNSRENLGEATVGPLIRCVHSGEGVSSCSRRKFLPITACFQAKFLLENKLI